MIKKGSIGIVVDDLTFNPLERVIEHSTGEAYHTFNYIGDGKITESLVGQGVVENQISKYYDKKSITLLCQPTNYFDDDVLDAVVRVWKRDIGRKYDVGNIIGKYLFRHSSMFNSKEKRICSEHTATGYYPMFAFMGKTPSKITPNDLLRFMVYTHGQYFECDFLNT